MCQIARHQPSVIVRGVLVRSSRYVTLQSVNLKSVPTFAQPFRRCQTGAFNAEERTKESTHRIVVCCARDRFLSNSRECIVQYGRIGSHLQLALMGRSRIQVFPELDHCLFRACILRGLGGVEWTH